MSVQPNATRKGLVDDLIAGLKADGIWSKLDWLCLLAAHDEQAARLNAANVAKSLTAVNSPTFTTDLGYSGDAATSYLSFGEVFSAAGNDFALDSACAGTWCNSQGAQANGTRHLSENNSTIRVEIHAHAVNGSNEVFKVNDGTSDIARVASVSGRLGHRTISRTAVDAKASYYNGVQTTLSTRPSLGLGTGQGELLRSGAGAQHSNDRLAACYTGSGLTDTEVGDLHTRLNTFLTAIGAA